LLEAARRRLDAIAKFLIAPPTGHVYLPEHGSMMTGDLGKRMCIAIKRQIYMGTLKMHLFS
jgi:hypothetical protein